MRIENVLHVINYLIKSTLTIMVIISLIGLTAHADENEDSHLRFDHDQVFEAVKSGLIKPLSAVLAIVMRDYAVPVIDVEFEIENGVWIYEIVTMGTGGVVTEYYYDAATARLLKIKSAGKVEYF